MPRAFLVVLDGVGIGGAPDAEDYGDAGANTLLHIAQARAEAGQPLGLPTLDGLGMGAALRLASGQAAPGLDALPQARWGAATEVSRGKDTPSGHWELAGVPVPFAWHTFPDTHPAFPSALTDRVRTLAGTEGVLGDCHASGTDIVARLGERHQETGWPIVYTSADSVLQIAAHEETFGLERLLTLCAALAPEVHAMRVGRVIARPFVGAPGDYIRTKNRRDFAMAPPRPTLCDWAADAGRPVHAIGKIGDIFSMRGIDTVATGPDAALMEALAEHVEAAADGALTFANFVEFDSLYGHRRDVAGFARHLEWADAGLGAILPRLRPGDLMLITADHGNDPTHPGTDHTRERVPVLVAGPLDGGGPVGSIGHVAFADIAASVAAHLGLDGEGPGRSFL